MSRIGNNPIQILSGVTVSVKDSAVTVKGKLGELSYTMPAGISAAVEGTIMKVSRANESRTCKSFHGLARTLINNMVIGVSTGYKKSLDIEGVGFKSELKGSSLMLNLGFANAKEYKVPAGVTVVVQPGGVKILIEGTDKQLVGRVAADVRSYYPAEPYKGKGIRYTGEKVRRKEGKTVA